VRCCGRCNSALARASTAVVGRAAVIACRQHTAVPAGRVLLCARWSSRHPRLGGLWLSRRQTQVLRRNGRAVPANACQLGLINFNNVLLSERLLRSVDNADAKSTLSTREQFFHSLGDRRVLRMGVGKFSSELVGKLRVEVEVQLLAKSWRANEVCRHAPMISSLPGRPVRLVRGRDSRLLSIMSIGRMGRSLKDGRIASAD
jgi:hypothetical protein